VIDGKSKNWNELTPEERAEIRRSITEAREELGRTRIDREEIEREVREAMAEAQIDQEELRRDLAEAQSDIAEAMKEIDAHSADIRRSGLDPEQLKATIRGSLKGIENIDVEAIKRNALASIDHRQIEASIAAAEAGVRAAEAELDRLEALDRGD
jgi:multidrug resistance efflux pump